MAYNFTMRRIVALVVGTFTAFSMLNVGACGLDSEGAAGPASDATADLFAPDVGVDVTHADVIDGGVIADGGFGDTPFVLDASDADAGGSCVAFTCNGQCVTSCNGCAAGNVACLASRECGTCANCPGAPLQCFACSGGAPTGTCQASATGASCASDVAGGACACPGGDAATCPGQTQICTGGGNAACRTCGGGGTDKKECAGGKFCTESTGACDRDQ